MEDSMERLNKLLKTNVDRAEGAHRSYQEFCFFHGQCLGQALIKEKDKEKKHKKEKKDKEKKEDNEKREKDRSDGNHRDKKDKKEKHREKKEKDRNKDKDKSSASDGKRLLGQAKLNNGGGKASEERKLPGQSKYINGDKAVDGRKLPEKFESNGGEVSTQKGKERDVDKNSISGDKKFAGQFSGYSGQKLIQNSNLPHQPKESKFVQELGKRVRDEDKNQFFEKFAGQDAKMDEGMFRSVAKAPGNCVGGNEKNKRDDDRKLDGQGIRDEARFSEGAQSLSGTFQARTDGMPRPLERDIEKKMEGKDKTKQKESEDKRKDKEKKGKEKDKVKDKEKKREEKAKEKSEHKKKEPVKLKESNMSDVVGNHTSKTSHLLKESTTSAANEVNIKKRKDSGTNGFFHANDIKPNKLPRPASSLPLSAENGRMLGMCQIPTAVVQGRQEAVYSDKVDDKDYKRNGLIEPQALSISSTTQPLSTSLTESLTKPSHSTAQTDQVAEVSRKQPHPDSKYLPEVLTVPKMEEWSDFEDQEWLFQSTNSEAKKSKVGFSGVDETPQVWSEALQIESADQGDFVDHPAQSNVIDPPEDHTEERLKSSNVGLRAINDLAWRMRWADGKWFITSAF
ncbi:unnamed protein product [Dovyalis caffra]|uniref:Uncharacterized protein n=1 Tax=Dovyalis caffra TaxID=77055 RepID=A0AAV1R3S8_9ROSI|nr:unnamed protein product [Dovyalis caffra]